MQDKDEKVKSLRYRLKASAWLFENSMHSCCGWYHSKDRRRNSF